MNSITNEGIIKLGKYIGAGMAITAAAGGAGVGIGSIVGKAIEATSRQPERKSEIMGTMFLGVALAETAAIYGLLVSILLLFVLN